MLHIVLIAGVHVLTDVVNKLMQTDIHVYTVRLVNI